MIRFDLPGTADVRLEVYDILGQGVPVGNGTYFYRLTAGEFTHMRRMLLLK